VGWAPLPLFAQTREQSRRHHGRCLPGQSIQEDRRPGSRRAPYLKTSVRDNARVSVRHRTECGTIPHGFGYLKTRWSGRLDHRHTENTPTAHQPLFGKNQPGGSSRARTFWRQRKNCCAITRASQSFFVNALKEGQKRRHACANRFAPSSPRTDTGMEGRYHRRVGWYYNPRDDRAHCRAHPPHRGRIRKSRFTANPTSNHILGSRGAYVRYSFSRGRLWGASWPHTLLIHDNRGMNSPFPG